MKEAFYYILLTLVLTYFSNSQWSTSIRAESSLYVCPGFYPGVVTDVDGSSIILGAWYNTIYAQKLNEYGYKMWGNPVLLHYNDSSYVGAGSMPPNWQWGGWISDDDGGVILFWYDLRGASFDTTYGFSQNNAIYAQRVDKTGKVMWHPGGLLVKEAETGMKFGSIVNDGSNGCIIAWAESEFDYPGAGRVERTRVQRISSNGEKLWEKVLDSTGRQFSLLYSCNVVRALDRIFVISSVGTNILTLEGFLVTNGAISGFGFVVSEKDSVLYNAILTGNTYIDSLGNEYRESRLTKLSAQLDTIWTFTGYIAISPKVHDGFGGVYGSFNLFTDKAIHTRVRRFNNGQIIWASEIQNTDITTVCNEDKGGIIVGSVIGKAWKFDSLGNPVWNNPVTVLENWWDTENIYISSDNNGGYIMAFWHIGGGIYAQHSGRYGRAGIITNLIEQEQIPNNFVLEQNYPNPFNPSTIIKFTVKNKSNLELIIYDVLGKRIKYFILDNYNPGENEVVWDGTDDNGNKVSSGVYFYNIISNYSSQTKRMLLMR